MAAGASPKSMLSQGLGWLQAAGQKAETAGESRGSTSAKVFGQSLSWISRELAPEAPPSMGDALRPLFFPPPAASTPAAAAVAPPKPAGGGGSTADAAARRSPARSEQDTRDALLSGGGRPSGKQAQKADAKDESREGRATREARGAASAMHESLNAAVERGEKLNQLGDKSQQLADDAADFADLAKQLRQREERGLFGALFG